MNVLHKRKRVEDHTDDDELEIPYKLGITNDVRPQNVKKKRNRDEDCTDEDEQEVPYELGITNDVS